ncbi:MAG TPA: hypothetical protein VIH35_08975 [Kiritimatiellia bacterium]|jgi:hypothetical protein
MHFADLTIRLAYIDPGTGGIILQMIMAGLVGVGFYFRKALKKFLGFFGGAKDSKPDESPHEPKRDA